LMATVIGVEPHFDLAMLKVDAKGLTSVEWTDSKSDPVGNWVASAGQGETPVAVGVVSVAARTLPAKEVTRPVIIANSGYLGIGLDPHKDGPRITNVQPDSAASKAGLKVDDHLLFLNGKRMDDPESVIATLSHSKPGDVVALKIKRGDEELDIKAKLDKRPVDRGDFQNRMGSELSDRRTGFPTFLQHDTVLKPHDCGGPLVDLDGKVIGINIARAGRVESYAIPAEAIQPLLDDLKSGKLAPVSKGPSAEEKAAADKVAAAKAALEKLEAEKAELEKKVAAEKADLEKRLAEAKAALEKAEAEAKNAKKPK
jgi:serine protease Do